jgi:hypothetical protein
MEAIQSRVESGPWNAGVKWVGHNAAWLGAVVVAFCLGAAWQNGSATTAAVSSVQSQYGGKLAYHVAHEKVLEKVAKTAAVAATACEKNLHAALDSAADPQQVRGCPTIPPVAPK